MEQNLLSKIGIRKEEASRFSIRTKIYCIVNIVEYRREVDMQEQQGRIIRIQSNHLEYRFLTDKIKKQLVTATTSF